jgi:hypothetical protein
MMVVFNGSQLYVRASVVLTCGKHLHDCIMSLRGEIRVHNTILPCHFLLKCQYQAKNVNDHVFVCNGH